MQGNISNLQWVKKSLSDEYLREIGEFECEEEGMEYFLKNEALNYDKDGEGKTYILINKTSHEIVGYYTLKCNAIEIDNGVMHKVNPAIEIARLAVHCKYVKNGIGSIILSLIMKAVLEVKKYVGVKYIFLFSVPKAEEFYMSKNRAEMFFKEMPEDVMFLKDENSQDECKPLIFRIDDLDEFEDN